MSLRPPPWAPGSPRRCSNDVRVFNMGESGNSQPSDIIRELGIRQAQVVTHVEVPQVVASVDKSQLTHDLVLGKIVTFAD